MFLSALLLLLCGSHVSDGYTQVSWQRSDTDGSNAGPRIYKALNADLVYPKVFNATETAPPMTSPTKELPTLAPKNHTSQPKAANYVAYQRQHEQHPQPQPDEQHSNQPAIFVTPSSLQDHSKANNNYIYANHRYADEMDDSMQPHDTLTRLEQQTNEEDEQVTAEEPLLDYAATGRAVDTAPPAYQLSQLIKPLIKNTAMRPTVISYTPPPSLRQRHPSIYEQRPQRQPAIMQRFSPGEAVVSQQLQQKQRAQKNKSKIPAASSFSNTYVPPKDLYSFPPNLGAKYPGPAQDPKAAVPSGKVNSYSAPPSGPLTNVAGYPLVAAASESSDGYKYTGPLQHGYLPPSSGSTDDTKDDDDASIGVLPATAMGEDDSVSDDKPDMMDMMNAEPDHGHPHDDDKEYPTPPPGWLEEHPEAVSSDHDHSHSFSHGYHYEPNIIFDHDYDHHHHHHDHPLPAMITTVPTPPEPPPEPRVKKYSYFYIGRKLWYIPLYFTVWFSFYVLWLIVKSIARHKVNLPNHYVARRNVDNNAFSTNTTDYINRLTVRVLRQIEAYGDKLQADKGPI